MTKEEMKGLKKGNLVTPSFDEEAYVVMCNYGLYVTVASHQNVSDPSKWLMCVDEKFIHFKELGALMIGDTVRLISTYVEYVITSKYSYHATAIRTVEIIDPKEWSRI